MERVEKNVHFHEEIEEDEVEEPVFYCELESSELFSSVLQGLLLNKTDQTGLFEVLPNGINLISERSKSLQAKAFFSSNTMETFEFRTDLLHEYNRNHAQLSGDSDQDEDVNSDNPLNFDYLLPEGNGLDSRLSFSLNFSVLYECVTLFGEHDAKSYRLCLSYYLKSKSMLISLQDELASTECELCSIETWEMSEFNFRSQKVQSRASIKCKYLREFIQDLEYASGDTNVCLKMSPDSPQFTVSAQGDVLHWQMEIPKDSGTDIIHSFDCRYEQTSLFNVEFFKSCFRCTSKSKLVIFRLSELGMLSVSFEYHSSSKGNLKARLDFVLCPTVVSEQ